MNEQNQKIRFMQCKAGDTVHLEEIGTMPELVHVFDEATIQAVDAALAAQRPLLVRGEPGIGKTQLARAVAKDLGRAYVQRVVDVRTESRDLMWRFDVVERLAEAQLRGALGEKTAAVHKRLSVENYLHPGPLWWAFDWQNAQTQAVKVGAQAPEQLDGGDPNNGCLVLVDEIDKAETDVPNGLLEAMGAGTFTPEGRHAPVSARGIAPLVVITTNEERALPDAFIRRCLVLHLSLPKLPDERKALIELLTARGRAHFEAADVALLTQAAELLCNDREAALRAHRLPLPGQAEYLDLLRAVLALKPDDPKQQQNILRQVSRFAVRKHMEEQE